MTDTSRRGGRLTCRLGDRHPHWGFDVGRYTHVHLFPPLHTSLAFFSNTRPTERSGTTGFYKWHGAVPRELLYDKHRSTILENRLEHRSLWDDPAVGCFIGTCESLNDHLESNTVNQSSPKTS